MCYTSVRKRLKNFRANVKWDRYSKSDSSSVLKIKYGTVTGEPLTV